MTTVIFHVWPIQEQHVDFCIRWKSVRLDGQLHFAVIKISGKYLILSIKLKIFILLQIYQFFFYFSKELPSQIFLVRHQLFRRLLRKLPITRMVIVTHAPLRTEMMAYAKLMGLMLKCTAWMTTIKNDTAGVTQ